MRFEPRRLGLAALLSVAIAFAHWALLAGWNRADEVSPLPAAPRATPASVVVRSLPAAASPAPIASNDPAAVSGLRPAAFKTAVALGEPVDQPVSRPAASSAGTPVSGVSQLRAAPPTKPAARPSATAVVVAQETQPEPPSPSTAPRAAADAEPVPVYPVRLPAGFDRRYRISRGFLSGQGHFRWSRDEAGRYESQLAGTVAGINVLDWVSRGEIDAAGVAPERFVVRRRGREVNAANFQRAAGKITYSGPAVEFALPPGAQDRLSWMVQLPAVLEAAPQRGAVGQQIVFFVSGARGDADVWQFVVEAQETVATGAGDVSALRLLRQPRKPYDTRVEVWLAPSQHHLPVRARLSQEGGGDPLELMFDPD